MKKTIQQSKNKIAPTLKTWIAAMALTVFFLGVTLPVHADCIDVYSRAAARAASDQSDSRKVFLASSAAYTMMPIGWMVSSNHPSRERTINKAGYVAGAVAVPIAAAVAFRASTSTSRWQRARDAAILGAAGGVVGLSIGRGAAAYGTKAAFENTGDNYFGVGLSALASASLLYVASQEQKHGGAPNPDELNDIVSILRAAKSVDQAGVSAISTGEYLKIEQLIKSSGRDCSVESVAKLLARSSEICVRDGNREAALEKSQIAKFIAQKAKDRLISDCQ